MARLGRALEGGAACNTTLRKLKLRQCCPQDFDGMQQLASSIARGALPNLQCLDLSWNVCCLEGGVFPLADATKNGALPRLQRLTLVSVEMDEEAAQALQDALTVHGGCPRLTSLYFGCDDEWTVAEGGEVLQQALASSRGPGAVEVEVQRPPEDENDG